MKLLSTKGTEYLISFKRFCDIIASFIWQATINWAINRLHYNVIIIIMNNIFTRYNFTYQKYYVHERKEKGDLPTGRAHTSIEIRNTIFTRKLFKIHIYK